MIIKGNARSGAVDLARHLLRADTNELVSVLEIRGTAASDLQGCFREMEGVAAGTRCGRPLYHANIDPARDYVMTDEQWAEAVVELETELGLTDQPRVLVKHVKHGREHMHIVWSRVDTDHMRAIPDSHNYRKHETVSRRLEKRFGHEMVQGVHVDRDADTPRPEAEFKTAEAQQADRLKIDLRQVKETLTGLWQHTDGAQAFAAALDTEGYILARGDRRDFVVIDPAGGVHALARRLDGVKTADVRARLEPIADILPSADQARADFKQRRAARAESNQPENQPPASTDNEPVRQQADAPEPGRKDQEERPADQPGTDRRADALRAEAMAGAIERFVARQAETYKAQLDSQMERLEAYSELRITRGLQAFDDKMKPRLPRDEAVKRKQQEQEKREALAVEFDSQPQKIGFIRRVGEFFAPQMRRDREQKEAEERAARAADRRETYCDELNQIDRTYDHYQVKRGVEESQLRQYVQQQKAKMEERNERELAQYQEREVAASYRALGATAAAHLEKLDAYRQEFSQSEQSARPAQTPDQRQNRDQLRIPNKAAIPDQSDTGGGASLDRHARARQPDRVYRVLNLSGDTALPIAVNPAPEAKTDLRRYAPSRQPNYGALKTQASQPAHSQDRPNSRVGPRDENEANIFDQQEGQYFVALEMARQREERTREEVRSADYGLGLLSPGRGGRGM